MAGAHETQGGQAPPCPACDIYRPAAIHQLEVVGQQLDTSVFQMGQTDPVDIAKAAVAHAREQLWTWSFWRRPAVHVDEELTSCGNIKAAVEPTEVLLVVDAMIGQDARNAARAFDDALDIDGVVLTKLDGDAGAGAGPVHQGGHWKAHQACRRGRELDQIEAYPRTGWPAGSWAWAMCSPSLSSRISTV